MVTKMSLQENFETYLKDNYRNRKQVGNTEDIPDFPLDFFQFLEERKRQLKKNERDENIWVGTLIISSLMKTRDKINVS